VSGGLAFVLDLKESFEARYNVGMVRIERLSHLIDDDLLSELI
jgi:glutamate synthase domain-containing protein 3